MTVREKLIQILKVPIHPHLDADPAEVVADYLLDNGVTVQQWIPCTEQLPTPVSKRNRYTGKCWTSETVLCVCVQNGGKRMVKEGRCEFYGDTPVWRIPGTIDSVTHWMPMPELPKGEHHETD